MFGDYSKRALKVLFITRLIAGQRFSPSLDTDDLVAAIVIEDQGESLAASLVGISLTEDHRTTVESVVSSSAHQAFFVADTAAKVLPMLKSAAPHYEPGIPLQQAIPLSAGLTRILETAQEIKQRFQQTSITPLHLLAAVIAVGNSRAADMLHENGISQEKIFEAIQLGTI